MSFSILFNDNNLIAVEKPEGLATIPERSPEAANLITELSRQMGRKLWVVHRLDKEVSGVILFAKNAETHRMLNDLFAEQKIRKTYLALVHGRVTADQGSINRGIRECGSGRMAVDDIRGKPSLTEFKVAERREHSTLVTVFPHSGRRHQIRVHWYSFGHPILGDPRYGDKQLQRSFPRLMLHAGRITIPSGESNDEINIESPIPQLFSLF